MQQKGPPTSTKPQIQNPHLSYFTNFRTKVSPKRSGPGFHAAVSQKVVGRTNFSYENEQKLNGFYNTST